MCSLSHGDADGRVRGQSGASTEGQGHAQQQHHPLPIRQRRRHPRLQRQRGLQLAAPRGVYYQAYDLNGYGRYTRIFIIKIRTVYNGGTVPLGSESS